MNKKRKNTSNLIFSAFLVSAFVICSYFFDGIVRDSTSLNVTLKSLFMLLIFVVFGLFLFYATRIGDGKQIKRFSLSTLLLMDLPALYIILAYFCPGLPFATEISQCETIAYLASVVFGYGVPYTFLSGYEQEIAADEETANNNEDKAEGENTEDETDTEDNDDGDLFEDSENESVKSEEVTDTDTDTSDTTSEE